jgi:hypothetical protein
MSQAKRGATASVQPYYLLIKAKLDASSSIRSPIMLSRSGTGEYRDPNCKTRRTGTSPYAPGLFNI